MLRTTDVTIIEIIFSSFTQYYIWPLHSDLYINVYTLYIGLLYVEVDVGSDRISLPNINYKMLFNFSRLSPTIFLCSRTVIKWLMSYRNRPWNFLLGCVLVSCYQVIIYYVVLCFGRYTRCTLTRTKGTATI